MSACLRERHPKRVRAAIRTVWDYHRLKHRLVRRDAIWVLGSHDLRVAEWAAELFLAGWAPRLILSGGLGNLTRGRWDEPEAVRFARVARAAGVPAAALILETRSTNTGENVLFTRRLLARRGVRLRSVIAVQKPYMERRTYATIRRQWPALRVRVSSPPLDFEAYAAGPIPREEIIHVMVGDLQRILVYPARGFMIRQRVPPVVRRAFDTLVRAGYTRHLLDTGRPEEENRE